MVTSTRRGQLLAPDQRPGQDRHQIHSQISRGLPLGVTQSSDPFGELNRLCLRVSLRDGWATLARPKSIIGVDLLAV